MRQMLTFLRLSVYAVLVGLPSIETDAYVAQHKCFTGPHTSIPGRRRRLRLDVASDHVTLDLTSEGSHQVDKDVHNDANFGIRCEHFGPCPGCAVNSDVTSIDVIENARRFFSATSIRRHCNVKGNSDDYFFRVIVPSSTTLWRTQAKLAVSSQSSWGRDGCKFGLYEQGSHRVMAIPNCMVHHPNINRAVHALTEATAAVQTVAYDENHGTGELRYVQIQVERSSGKVCLALVLNIEKKKHCQPRVSRLIKELRRLEPELWQSFWGHMNTGIGNNIFSRGKDKWFLIDGPEFAREPIPRVDNDYGAKELIGSRPATTQRSENFLYSTPLTFRQANLDGFDVIAAHVARCVPVNAAVCELYAGVGVLGLATLLHAHHSDRGVDGTRPNEKARGLRLLRCSDENEANLRCFEKSLSNLSVDVTERSPRKKIGSKDYSALRENTQRDNNPDKKSRRSLTSNVHDKVSYSVASAAQSIKAGRALGVDVIIVDPPRKGLDEDVIAQLCKRTDPAQHVDSNFLDALSEDLNLTNEVGTLIYVSCFFDSLARDCEKLLLSNAGWILNSCTGYLLFPGSNHIETVAVFKRTLTKKHSSKSKSPKSRKLHSITK